MSPRKISSALAGALLSSAAFTQFAHAGEDTRFYGAIMPSYVILGDNREGDPGEDDDAVGMTALTGLSLTENLYLEFLFSGARYKKETSRDDTFIFGAMLDLAYHFNGMFDRLVPLAIAGLGVVTTDSDNGGGESSSTDQAAEFGIGFIMPLTESGTGLRADVRYRLDSDIFGSERSGEKQQDLHINIGAHIPFGIKSEAGESGPPTDNDKDGIPDYRDRCPGTPPGLVVNVWGCPIDSDADGVGEPIDQCPGTPAGSNVDGRGCVPNLDSDGDSVVNSKDRCPDTQAGMAVNKDGCAIKQNIVLKNVNFEFNSAILTVNAERILNGVAKSMKGQRSMEVEIGGHTDALGPELYNQKLSERRAASVRDYLVSQGVARNRMTAVGYGESDPVASNDTEEGRAINRRVVFTVTEE